MVQHMDKKKSLEIFHLIPIKATQPAIPHQHILIYIVQVLTYQHHYNRKFEIPSLASKRHTKRQTNVYFCSCQTRTIFQNCFSCLIFSFIFSLLHGYAYPFNHNRYFFSSIYDMSSFSLLSFGTANESGFFFFLGPL